MAFVKVLDLANEIEANLFEAILAERGIAYVVRRNVDQALAGFFDSNFVWGWLEAEAADAGAIRELFADVQAADAATDEAAD